jgi:hypothetical protein
MDFCKEFKLNINTILRFIIPLDYIPNVFLYHFLRHSAYEIVSLLLNLIMVLVIAQTISREQQNYFVRKLILGSTEWAQSTSPLRSIPIQLTEAFWGLSSSSDVLVFLWH